MKKNNIFTLIASTALFLVGFSSCIGDLDRFPENETTGENVYSTFGGYRNAIIKVYASFALTGNEGPAGKPDISGLDEGSYADFLRMFFNHQELPTDEAHCIWQDEGIPGIHVGGIQEAQDGCHRLTPVECSISRRGHVGWLPGPPVQSG